MTRRLAIAVLLSALTTGPALAAPFGGDDTGTIPSDPAALKYEGKIAKSVAKFNKCVFKCHVCRLTSPTKCPDDVGEDNCENVCAQKFDAKTNSTVLPPPPSATCVNPVSIRNVWVAELDGDSNQVFCDGTTPSPAGDDTLNITTDPAALCCEKRVALIAAKLLKCQTKCHDSRARGKIVDETGEESCENDLCVTAKYNGAITSTIAKCGSCPPCFNSATLASNLLARGDQNNGLVYCAP